MRLLIRQLITLFSGREKQPWEKGNSWLVKAGIADLSFNVQKVTYHDAHDGGENLTAGIADLSFVVTDLNPPAPDYQKWEYHTDSPVLTADYPYQVVITQSGGAHGLLVAQGFIYVNGTYLRSVGASRYYSAWSNGGAWSLAASWAPNESTYMRSNLGQFTEVEANENVRSGDKSSTWFAKTTP